MPASYAIELEAVCKSFGPRRAVEDLSLQVPAGSLYGFIGPNGSGKTTTLRMIVRILPPDAGRVVVLGSRSTEAADDRVAYLPEERGLYKHMKVREVLQFFSRVKGHEPTCHEIQDWLERMGLGGEAEKRVSALSKGMSQKVQFIATVIARPQLLLLDEPFSGLDPLNATVLRQVILELKRAGTTVVFSTHDMAVAEELCDFVFMIHQGRKVLDGSLASIRQQFGRDTLRIGAPHETAGAALRAMPGVLGVTDGGNLLEVRLAVGADPQEILRSLLRRCPVEHFELARPSLRDIFIRIAAAEAQ